MDNVAIKSIYVSPLQGLNKQQENKMKTEN